MLYFKGITQISNLFIMDNLSGYLKKFKNLLSNEYVVREKVREVIVKSLGIDIAKEDIRIKHGVVYLKTRSIIKNEVFIRKSDLLKEINKEVSVTISDIK